MKFSTDAIIKVMRTKGYKVFTEGIYNINFVGVRKDTKEVTDEFVDTLCVFYRGEDGLWNYFEYPCTTMAGLYYFLEPMLPNFGTAILAPGQYRGVYALGKHYGLPALVQVGNLKVYRDNNRDSVVDLDAKTLSEGAWFGINVHYSWRNRRIGKWSAGCQVLPYEWNSVEYREFLSHFEKASKIWGNRFTYTLLLESDFENK